MNSVSNPDETHYCVFSLFFARLRWRVQITIGRKSEHDHVDVDLLLEGPAHKVSRRQGTIKLRSNGDFFITNEGKRPLFIDGVPLLHGNKTKLNNNCTIEVSVGD